MSETTGKAFDFKLFKRLLGYTKPYKWTFVFVAVAAIAIAALGVLSPILLQKAIDPSILPKDYSGLVFYIILMITVLLVEVIFNFSFMKPINRTIQFVTAIAVITFTAY